MNECPKCGFDQVEAGECAWCGIIIAKYQERNPAARDGPTDAQDHPADGSDPNGGEERPAPLGRNAAGQPMATHQEWLDKAKGLWRRPAGRFAPAWL